MEQAIERSTAPRRRGLAIGLGVLAPALIAATQAFAAPSWLAPLDLSATGQDADDPQVALDPQGNATAVWWRSNGANTIIQQERARRPEPFAEQ